MQSTYGIQERSALGELSQCDITKHLPQDLMHILLEGSVQYGVRYVLQHFINNGLMTLNQLNSKFTQMRLGYQDEANRPCPVRETMFNGQEKCKLKQTADQARIFLKYLLFILRDYVPNENPYY